MQRGSALLDFIVNESTRSVQQFVAIPAIMQSDGPPPTQRRAGRGRTGQLLRRGPRAAHGAVQRLDPRRPTRTRARSHPHRPGHRPAHRRGRGGRRRGPGASSPSSTRSPPTSRRRTTSSRVPGASDVIGTTARWLVPRLVEEMAAHFPQVQVIVYDATTSSLVLQLASGSIDLAVLTLPVDDPDLQSEPLFDEDRLLVTPPEHPLADRDRITLADLDDVPLLLEPRGTPFRDDARGADPERRLPAPAPGRGRRHPPHGLARLPGLRRRHPARQRHAVLARR